MLLPSVPLCDKPHRLDVYKRQELRKAALYVADRKILFYLIEGERFTESSFEKQDLPKEEAGLDRTLSLIDTVLSSLPEEAAAKLFRFKVQIYDKPEIYNEKPAGIYICYFLPLRYS